MKSDFKAVKAVQIIFGAIILSCCIFGGIYGIGVNGLTIFFNNSRYIYDHESQYVQEFQQYVSQKNIAASDISECDEWMDYHCVLFCIIEKDGEVDAGMNQGFHHFAGTGRAAGMQQHLLLAIGGRQDGAVKIGGHGGGHPCHRTDPGRPALEGARRGGQRGAPAAHPGGRSDPGDLP